MKQKKIVITAPDLYTTQGGRVAFIHAVEQDSAGGGQRFHGYLLYSERGQTRKKMLTWLPCGTCIDSDSEQDTIVWKV